MMKLIPPMIDHEEIKKILPELNEAMKDCKNWADFLDLVSLCRHCVVHAPPIHMHKPVIRKSTRPHHALPSCTLTYTASIRCVPGPSHVICRT